MKKMLLMTVLMLATLAWAAAQQSGSTASPSSGQTSSPTSQAPSASQPQPSTPDSAGQDASQAGSQGQQADAPVIQGCLGGSSPNYTITDKAGTTYKLNIPSSADASKLASHVGEPVQVMGGVNGTSSIDVQAIGPGTGKCPAGGATGAQPPTR